MKMRSVILTAVLLAPLLAIAVRAGSQAAAPQAPDKLVKAKVDAARKTYDAVWQNNKEGLVPFVEVVYRWSRRWLEAELELSARKADQVAAYQAHGDRMRELARATRGRFRNRVNTIEETTAVDFYMAEAAIWIDQARNK